MASYIRPMAHTKNVTLLREMFRTWRRVNGVSLNKLAKKMGVPTTVLCRFELGRNVRSDMAIKIILQLISI